MRACERSGITWINRKIKRGEDNIKNFKRIVDIINMLNEPR